MIQTVLAIAIAMVAPVEQIDVVVKKVVSLESMTFMGIERMMPVMQIERTEQRKGRSEDDHDGRTVYVGEDSTTMFVMSGKKFAFVTIHEHGRADVREMDAEEFGRDFFSMLTGERYEGPIEDFTLESAGLDKIVRENERRKTGRKRTIAGVECEENYVSATMIEEEYTIESFMWEPIDEDLRSAYGIMEQVQYYLDGDERILQSYKRTLEVKRSTEPMPKNWPEIYDDEHSKPLGGR